ncbi:uncharacterized protein LOC119974532 isoform X4 [Scyliorhinus canicula]|uniref:uncharacterized protein LOC119974532 isoform X4 n=1 Tax=Scyliorhinus canicula TaxID=7830 RepID=UPI0018F3D15A|nr:uncharacterized protein LOC119974532 isoform X4 [Scyliorhinus canicula]
MEWDRLVALVVCCSLISSAEPQPFRILVKKQEVNATVGDTVILSVRPSSPVSGGFWKFGTESIVIWTVEAPYLNVAYTKRFVHLLDNTSLLMYSVTLSDSGDYWVTMDSPSGDEATARITLNVFPKPVPFTIAVKHSEISTIAGDTVVLSVSPSQEVKNGSWRYGGKDVVTWEGTLPEVNPDYRRRAAILAKSSLQLKSVSTSDTGEYSVTMSTASGNTSTAKIYLNVHKSARSCETYNVGLAISILLMLICILVIANHIRKKNQTAAGEIHDFLTVFCKGYRVCVSLTMVMSFNFLIIFSSLINWYLCAPGERPAMDFSQN